MTLLPVRMQLAAVDSYVHKSVLHNKTLPELANITFSGILGTCFSMVVCQL